MKAHISKNVTAMKDQSFPVFEYYAGELSPQPAYISIDLRTGEIDAGFSGEIGNAVPADVYHGLVRRFRVSPYLTGQSIKAIIAERLPEFQGILDDSSTEWINGNHVGISGGTARLIADGFDWQGIDEAYREDDVIEWGYAQDESVDDTNYLASSD